MPLTGLTGLSGGPFGIGGPFGSSVSSAINTPQILTPIDGATDQNYDLTITSSAFDPEGTIDTHTSSDWQLASDPSFVNVVASSLADTVNLTSWSVNDLEANVTHYVRVRYKGESPEKESEWSEASSFTTLSSFIQKPSITGPTGSVVVNPVTLTATGFVSGGKVDTHVSSDWQIALDSGFANIVKSTSNDTTNKVTWSPSGSLNAGVTYYARVRYTGGPETLTSDWSDTLSFRMLAVPVIQWVSDTPSSWSPTAGDNRTFNATANDTANSGGPHNTYSYQWYRNGSPVSGYTGQYFDFYNPVYYSDNGNSLYCRVTITNAAGSTSGNSTTCSISVTRNVQCEDTVRFDNIKFSGGGGKPGGGTNTWGEWRVPREKDGVRLDEICGLSWNLNGSLKARARPGRCPNGYKMTLRWEIDGAGVNYRYEQSQDAGDGGYGFFNPNGADNISASGAEPRFRVIHVGGMSYTRCNSPPDNTPDFLLVQDGDCNGWVDVKTRVYNYDSRP